MPLPHLDQLRYLLSQGPQTPRQLQQALHVSQPTLSRLLSQLEPDVVRMGAARSTRYIHRDRHRGMGDVPVYRISTGGQIERLGELVPVRPEGFVMRQDDGPTLHSDGLPWWLLDMRPQGFLGRAYAQRHAAALGLPSSVQHWSDTDAMRALLAHGHDAVGNLLLGDMARHHFLSQSSPRVVLEVDKGRIYADMAQQALQGDMPASSAAGEQPKFTTYAETAVGPRHVLVKFSLQENNPITQRWRDLLLAEHHALETLRDAGIAAVSSCILDHEGQRFLEVERFDRVDATGRQGLISLSALEAEFVGQAHQPWPVLVAELVRQKVVHPQASEAAQVLYAFGKLIGNTDMHTGNLSFLNEQGRPCTLAPAYDMLPMAFAPMSGGGLGYAIPALDLHASVTAEIWHRVLPLAQCYLQRVQTEKRFTVDFAPCIDSLGKHLDEASRRIALLN